MEPPEDACEPGTVLRGLVEHWKAGLPTGIRLDLAQGAVLADPSLLEAVLGDAVANAVAALREAGRIRIPAPLTPDEAWLGFRWLAIAVKNDGPSLSEALLRALGRVPFTRPGRNGGGGGYLIGLSISRGLAEAMGGAFVAGNPPEGGCRIVLHLPVLAGGQ